MTIHRDLICSSHTISGVMPGGPVPARHGFEERVAACAAAGYTGMCLHFRDYRALKEAGHKDEDLREVLQRHGMRHVSLEFLVDWFLDGTDSEQARADEATLHAAARAYGADSFNIGSDFQGRGIPRAVMKERLAGLCRRAGNAGLKVALEIVPWSDVPDVETALDMIDGIDNAGLVVDSWHIFRGGVPLSEVERIPGDRIFCVQVNDAEETVHGALSEDTTRRKPCGEGVFDLDAFLDSLNRAGADVPVSVEIISPQFAALDVESAARGSIAGARRLVERHAARTSS
ncbi:sugar phosphate isomerase/epimerase [Oricola sp.]|uniref:sugar phosphate isomerase/epimerase family protein n=1 Tax=Oricola sp. TaxID=1979950 RepID=UPI0025E6867F|nr:sugar phosphate isomerase/epimerase [Oricola sp.]MCI5074444.1 sugar phosphate isomerase/epimerase [Oricola sp.]